MVGLITHSANFRYFVTQALEMEELADVDDLDPTGVSVSNFDALIIDGDCDSGTNTHPLEQLERYRLLGCNLSAVVLSFLEFEEIIEKFAILSSPGISFLRLPVIKPKFLDAIEQASKEKIKPDELQEYIRWQSGLQKVWRDTLHVVTNLSSDYPQRIVEIRSTVDTLSSSIEKYAPDQKPKFDKVKDLVDREPNGRFLDEIRSRVEDLDSGLRFKPDEKVELSSLTQARAYNVPRCAPKGFSRVLIADDNPTSTVINTLSRVYKYDVLNPATTLFKAKQLLDQEKPHVVLADLFFKESNREGEVPSEEIGYRFIKYAIAKEPPNRPLVLVTSKSLLRTETEIPVGAINCSGSFRATRAEEINAIIWREALKAGVTETAEINGREWLPENECREQLELVAEELPFIIKQWSECPSLIQETLSLCLQLKLFSSGQDSEILDDLVSTLEPYEYTTDYSLEQIEAMFRSTTSSHLLAKEPPESDIKNNIRNILHGKIEQFSSVVNAIRTFFSIVTRQSVDLKNHESFAALGEDLNYAAVSMSESKDVLPQLAKLYEVLRRVLEGLPEIPRLPPPTLPYVPDIKRFRILVVEDTKYWSDFTVRAVAKVAEWLGEGYELTVEVFDNLNDAVAAVPKRRSTYVIADGTDFIPTIAIVDVCLPTNREEANEIRRTRNQKRMLFVSPDRRNGINLIKTLTDFEYNVPLIVFSTVDSIEDRRKICSFGVPEQNFISKRHGAERELKGALSRLFEGSKRHFIKRYDPTDEDEYGEIKYWVDRIEIQFPDEIKETFTAIYDVAWENAGRFTVEKIIDKRSELADDETRKKIHDHIYRIRRRIFDNLRERRHFVNASEIIKTKVLSPKEHFYLLNAEILTLGEDYEDDLTNLPYNNRVLVVDSDETSQREIAETLTSLGYRVDCVQGQTQNVDMASRTEPDIAVINADYPEIALEEWSRIKNSFPKKDIGILLTIEGRITSDTISYALQANIPLRNLVSKEETGWCSVLATRVLDEQKRIFLGETPSDLEEAGVPIVEILEDCDFANGKLSLLVNNLPFITRKSQISKILGFLILNPNEFISFESLKESIIGRDKVTIDDRRNWPKRIRETIENDWLRSSPIDDRDEISKTVLQYGEDGMKLNIQVIHRRSLS